MTEALPGHAGVELQHEVAALVKGVEGAADEALGAAARRRPLLFLAPHMGSFEVTAQYASLQVPITVLYRAPKMAWLEPLMQEGRSRGRVRLEPLLVVPVAARGAHVELRGEPE